MWTISNRKDWSDLEAQFAWVARMNGVRQDPHYHAEGDVAVHTRMVLAALEADEEYQQLKEQEQEILWAAALLHDVEKYSTTVEEPDGRITSAGHARKGAMTARQILYLDMPAPFAIREQIVGLVRYHGLPLWVFEKADPIKAAISAGFEVNTAWLAMLARADVNGRICDDKQELLYKIDCFAELCREQQCWAQPREFATEAAKIHYLHNEEAFIGYVPFDNPVFEVVLMSGLPGAGKSFYIDKRFSRTPMVSLDDIRIRMGVAPADQSGNGRVIQEAKEQARVLLRKRQSFVWNATNTTRSMRQQLIELFMTYGARVKIVYVEVPFTVLAGQNMSRDAMVPVAVLDKLIRKLEVPSPIEAHEVIYEVKS